MAICPELSDLVQPLLARHEEMEEEAAAALVRTLPELVRAQIARLWVLVREEQREEQRKGQREQEQREPGGREPREQRGEHGGGVHGGVDGGMGSRVGEELEHLIVTAALRELDKVAQAACGRVLSTSGGGEHSLSFVTEQNLARGGKVVVCGADDLDDPSAGVVVEVQGGGRHMTRDGRHVVWFRLGDDEKAIAARGDELEVGASTHVLPLLRAHPETCLHRPCRACANLSSSYRPPSCLSPPPHTVAHRLCSTRRCTGTFMRWMATRWPRYATSSLASTEGCSTLAIWTRSWSLIRPASACVVRAPPRP